MFARISETLGTVVGQQHALRQLCHIVAGRISGQEVSPPLFPLLIPFLYSFVECLAGSTNILCIIIVRQVIAFPDKMLHALIQSCTRTLHHGMQQVFEIDLQVKAVACTDIQTGRIIGQRHLAQRIAQRETEKETAIAAQRRRIADILTAEIGQRQTEFAFVGIEVTVQHLPTYHYLTPVRSRPGKGTDCNRRNQAKRIIKYRIVIEAYYG